MSQKTPRTTLPDDPCTTLEDLAYLIAKQHPELIKTLKLAIHDITQVRQHHAVNNNIYLRNNDPNLASDHAAYQRRTDAINRLVALLPPD